MEGTLQNIALTDIKDHVGTPPSSKLRTSIRRMGVVQPVVLSEQVNVSGEIQYVIVDGNRRISAARTARLQTIPAMVIQDLEADQISQLTLILNGYRSANFLTEFWAIRSLTRSKFTFDDIQNLSGYATSSIEHRESLGSLNREIFVALRNGKIIQTFASAIAKLPKAEQEELAGIYLRRGRLLKREIDEISRRARRQTSRIDVRPPVIPSAPGIRSAITYDETSAKLETYHVNVPTHRDDLPPDPFIAEPDVARPSTSTVDIPMVQTPVHTPQVSVADVPTPLMPSPNPVEYSGSDLSLDDQRAAMHELRSHLVSAANIAASFGMDRFEYLAQASKMWDSREKETQTRLIPREAPPPVISTPMAASRAGAEG